MKLYLHQYLSRSGRFKRKNDAMSAIGNGLIKVGNKVIKNPNYIFDPKKHGAYYKNKPLKISKKKIYLVLNKPAGYLSSKLTRDDTKLGKKSVFELIDIPEQKTLFCVGRLDEDSSGLLILTNDGQFGYKITAPESKVGKTYYVVLKRPLKNVDYIENGVEIELEENNRVGKYLTKQCKVEKLSEREALITLTEGKKREVKRIFEAVGNEVIKLKRVKIGNLELGQLPEGKYKLLSKEEIAQIL